MVTFKIKKGLGRGLSSLIGETKAKDNQSKIPIGDLIRNKYQPRKFFNKDSLEELTNSIREQGVIQPIIVRKSKDQDNKYEIIAGERRWLASQNAGLNEVPTIILNIDDLKSLEFAIIENVQRKDLNPIEEAQGYQRLIDDFSYDQEKISKFIGKSRSHVANFLRLLSLPKEVLDHLEKEEITAGHAKILVGLENSKFIVKKIINKKLSVRQSENLVRFIKGNKNIKLVPNKNLNIINLEKNLEEKTGLSINIQNKKNNSGKISFEYNDLEQLDRLINSIKKSY